jgi:hypothetical protein
MRLSPGGAACAVGDNSAVVGTIVTAPTLVTNKRRVTFGRTKRAIWFRVKGDILVKKSEPA